MTAPVLWIVAGPNGAGKTTCVQTEPIRNLLPGVRFLNPDDTTRQLLLARGFGGFADAPHGVQFECFVEAATRVERELLDAIDRGETVGVETVLSTGKYRAVVERVRLAGGSMNLIYITVASPAVSAQRIAARVARGGHGVPPEKIVERFHRSHANLNWFAAHAANFWVVDNSGSDPAVPPVMVAFGSGGRLELLDPAATDAVKLAVAQLPGRPPTCFPRPASG